MARITKAELKAKREKLRKRVKAESERIGEDLTKRKAPIPVPSGKFAEPKKSVNKESISVKPRSIFNIIGGAVTRERVRRATEVKKDSKVKGPADIPNTVGSPHAAPPKSKKKGTRG